MHLVRAVEGDGDNAGMDLGVEEVRAALARVVASPQFTGAERLRRFLTYVVERAIEGRADELKEFVVASAVFDRDQSYDPRLDAVVRVEAGRLRSRLTEYYAESGVADPVVIRIPKGGYAPVWERRVAALSTDVQAPRAPAVEPPAPSPDASADRPSSSPAPWRARTWTAAALAAILVVGVVVAWSAATRAPAAAVAGASVAVLPLDGETGAASAESLSRALVGSGVVDVVAHSRVRDAVARGLTIGQIAEAFDADYTVEGNVRTRDETLTIEVVLVEASLARKFWVQSFTGQVSAREALLRETASAIGQAIEARRASH